MPDGPTANPGEPRPSRNGSGPTSIRAARTGEDGWTWTSLIFLRISGACQGLSYSGADGATMPLGPASEVV
jgi:hypothetical protein